MSDWPVLNVMERRVLGVLVEKAKTTPEVYPMTINALINACNQKSNRDPVMNADEPDVDEALESLQKKGLVIIVQSSRVDRWRQALYDVWLVGKVELAVIAELLLRGPQTEGELRGRAARMEPIEDMDQLRAILKPLVEKKFVVYLTPERSRGTMVTHGFHSPEELQRLRTFHSTGIAAEATPAPVPVSRPAPPPVAPSPELKADVERLDSDLKALRSELTRGTTMVTQLQQALGVTP